MEALLALFLAFVLLAGVVTPGAATLRLAGLNTNAVPSRWERWLLSASLGLGVQALALTLLGLARLFYAPLVLALPILIALAAVPLGLPLLRSGLPGPAVGQAGDVTDEDISVPQAAFTRWLRLLAVALLFLLVLCVAISNLAPPTDYDGLLYHLVAPRAYLQQHAIIYIPHNFSANLPMFGEMLFAHGLAGGSDRAPQLVHAAAGVLSVAITGVFGRRFIGSGPAFWGAAGLAATPLVPFLATRAYIDLFTLLFGLMAIFGVLFWLRDRNDAWLRVAGVAAGFAFSSKYSALTLLLVLGSAVLIASLGRRPVLSRTHIAQALGAGLSLSVPAAVVALPWFARQLIVLGNPVWPMYFGGRDWDAVRVEQLTYFVSQYGSGARFLDWLLLPVNVYRESWRFGHVPDSFPPLLGLAAPLALLWRRPSARWLLGITAGSAVLWARGWQDLRFLLSIYPALALLGAAGLFAVTARWRAGRFALCVGVTVLLVLTLQREAQRAIDRLPVVIGAEPAQTFLLRTLEDHRAITLLNDQVPEGYSALFLGDGQIWYCRQRCIPDPAHDNLLMWFTNPAKGQVADAERTLRILREERVSHILLSKKDLWYLEHQDPENRLKKQLAQFYLFKAHHLDLVYEDPLMEVYRARW